MRETNVEILGGNSPIRKTFLPVVVALPKGPKGVIFALSILSKVSIYHTWYPGTVYLKRVYSGVGYRIESCYYVCPKRVCIRVGYRIEFCST